jgi:hypothetical protein
MVMDQYRPYIPPYWPYRPAPPLAPADLLPPRDTERLERLLDSFRKALEAAEEFDQVTGQPDCVDPEKAELLKRVAELERRLEEVERS